MNSRCLKEVAHFFLSDKGAAGTAATMAGDPFFSTELKEFQTWPCHRSDTPAVSERPLFGIGGELSPGIILLDHQRKIHFVSPTAQSLLNLRHDECIGEPFNYFIREGEKIRVGIFTRNKKMGIGVMSMEKEAQAGGEVAYLISIREIRDLHV